MGGGFRRALDSAQDRADRLGRTGRYLNVARCQGPGRVGALGPDFPIFSNLPDAQILRPISARVRRASTMDQLRATADEAARLLLKCQWRRGWWRRRHRSLACAFVSTLGADESAVLLADQEWPERPRTTEAAEHQNC